MSFTEIRRLRVESREGFFDGPRPQRDQPIGEWAREAEERRLQARWLAESEQRASRADPRGHRAA